MFNFGPPNADEGYNMQRPRFTFDFNLGTLLPIGLALVGLVSYIKSLENRIDLVDQRGQQRIAIEDGFYAKTEMSLQKVARAPDDINDLKKGQDLANARMDKFVDLFQAGQERTTAAMQTGFDTIRKDISTLSSNVAVINSQLQTRPQPGAFRPPHS